MKEIISPRADIVISKNKIECLFYEGVTCIEGDYVGRALLNLLPYIERDDINSLGANAHDEYDIEGLSGFIEELRKDGILVPGDDYEEQAVLSYVRRKDLALWETLPNLSEVESWSSCNGIGFRLGREYVLVLKPNIGDVCNAIRLIYEWAATQEWLKRGKILFAPTEDEAIVSSRSFFPKSQDEWVQAQISYLATLPDQEAAYIINPINGTVTHFPLEKRLSSLCTVGPLTYVPEAHLQNGAADDPFRRFCSAAACRYRLSPESWNDDAWAWGSNSDPGLALDIAYAEAMERYCAGHFPESDLRIGTLMENKKRINPYTLMPLKEQQLIKVGLVPFKDHSPAMWVRATEYFSGREVELLADLCLYPFFRQEGYEPYFRGSSSGMAAHTTRENAMQSAMLELIERDAFMRTWLFRESPPHIACDVLQKSGISHFEDVLKVQGYTLELLDITKRNVPTVFAVIHNEKWPAFCCGCATRTTYEEACVAAYREAEAALFGALRGKEEIGTLHPHEVAIPEHHGMLYYNPEYLSQVEFLWQSQEHKCSDSLPKLGKVAAHSLERIADEAGVSTLYIVEYPCPDSKLNVIRLDTPDLVPVSFGYGLEPHVEGSHCVENRFPHPFA